MATAFVRRTRPSGMALPARARWLGTRLLRTVAITLFVSFIAFVQIRALPGDPATQIAPDGATPEQIARIRTELGLDEPVLSQYWSWLGDLVRGDLGTSYRTNIPVTEMLGQRLPVSLELMVVALVLSLVVAIPLGLWSAYRQGGIVDRVISGLALFFISIPRFVLGVVLILIFAVTLKFFPASGFERVTDSPLRNLRSLVLPVITLAAAPTAIFIRVLRSDVISTLREDFVLLARSQGIRPLQVLVGVALRPSMLSLVTVVGITVGHLIGGSVLVETVFGLPGFGSLLVTAVNTRDYVLLQAMIAIIALTYVVVNFVVDLMYGLLDPRIRRG